jgi:hypothetical protein
MDQLSVGVKKREREDQDDDDDPEGDDDVSEDDDAPDGDDHQEEGNVKQHRRVATQRSASHAVVGDTTVKPTCILAPEVKRINTSHLEDVGVHEKPILNRFGVDPREERALELERRRDMIYNLLSSNEEPGAHERLRKFVQLAHTSLWERGVYPIDPEGKRDSDARVVDEMYRAVLHSDQLSDKRAFIIVCLYICPPFVDKFCPRVPTGGMTFLTNPEILTEFLHGTRSPLPEILSRFIAHQFTSKTFAAAVLSEWTKLTPWEDMDQWQRVDPRESSVEVKLLANVPFAPTDRLGPAAAGRYLLTNNPLVRGVADGAGGVIQDTTQLAIADYAADDND